MINFLDEIYDLLSMYNLNLNKVILVVNGNVVESDEFLEKYNVFYDDGFYVN